MVHGLEAPSVEEVEPELGWELQGTAPSVEATQLAKEMEGSQEETQEAGCFGFQLLHLQVEQQQASGFALWPQLSDVSQSSQSQ